MSQDPRPVCVVAGIGPGNGASLARRFGNAGYAVALLSRSTELASAIAAELPRARVYACDVADAANVERTYERIRADLGAVEALVYNAGSGAFGNIEAATAEDFERAWRVNALGAFLAAKQVIPAMKEAGRGAIVYIGATASVKGGARTPAFAAAKFAQRGLAQSMARHLGPLGIHVAIVVVDGVIDLPRTRSMMPDKPDSFFLSPDAVAEAAFQLARQPRSGWTFELDVRPFAESW